MDWYSKLIYRAPTQPSLPATPITAKPFLLVPYAQVSNKPRQVENLPKFRIGDASHALDRLKNERYNVILLDIKLPSMSGIELYKHILETAQSLARRVAFITGDVSGLDTKDFHSKTKAPYIIKAFNIE